MDTRTEKTELSIQDQFSPSLLQFWQLVSKPQKYAPLLKERFGDFVMTNYGGEQGVVALTPDGARQILTGNPDGYDAFWKKGFTGVAGPGSLWVLGGDKHRRERTLLSPAFHAQRFRGYGEVIRTITNQKTEKWQAGQTLRVIDTTLSISMDVIMQVVFGMEDDKFMQEGRKVLSALLQTYHPLIIFFPNLQRRWFPPWIRHIRAKADFSNWLYQCLVERRAREAETDDLLALMMTAKYDDGNRMRDEDIRDELVTILLAGHETTATALAWALYELGRHPAKLEKLRAEIASLGPGPEPGMIVKLPYLSAVCNETLRLHTLLPEVARVLTSTFNFFNFTLPPGAYVLVSVMAIHHDPELYPKPSTFIPERFVGHTFSPFEFLPFGGGHRRCLGSGLSDYEMRIALAEIITHWEFESAKGEHEIRHDIAMGPKNGVRLHIKSKLNPLLTK